MSANDPWAMLDDIAGPEGTQSPAPTSSPKPQPQKTAPVDAWAQLDQMAGPEAQQPQPTQAAAQPAQSVEVLHPSNMNIAMSGDQAARSEKLRGDVGQLLNSGASREQIAARMAQDGFSIGDVDGLDRALTWRSQHPGSIIPVASKAPEQQPQPQDFHGPDAGRGDAFGKGAADAIFMGGIDELGGAIGATENSIKGVFGGGTGESWGDAYARIRDDNRQGLADASHYHDGAFMGGQLVGGALSLPVGGGEAALARGGLPALGRIAAEGAGLGGVYGFNSANGDITDRLQHGAEGAALGAIGGVAVGGPMNAVARGIAANRVVPSAGREILNAADRLNAQGDNIRPLVGHVSDGGVGSLAHAILEPTLTGGRLGGLTNATQRFENSVGASAERIANDAAGGQATNLVSAAERLNDPNRPGSLAAYRQETRDQAGQLFRAADQLGGHEMIEAPRTTNALDAKLAEWRRSPVAPAEEGRFQQLRDTLAQGEDGSGNGLWSVQGLRRARTIFGRDLQSASPEAREAAGTLWGPLSHDVQSGLVTNGNLDAARAYTSANNDYRRRMRNLDVIDRVVGSQPGELSADKVAQRLNSMSSNDYDRLGRALRAVDPSHAQDMRGGLIQELGRPIASRQNGQADTFSIESFATRWLKMSDQAKAAMFAPGTVRDLNDLATMAGSARRVARLGNPSRSGVLLQNVRQLEKFGEIGLAAAHGVTSLSTIGSVLGTAAFSRLLAMPGVARVLVAAGENRPTAFIARRIGELARRYPAMEQEFIGLREAIQNPPQDGVTVN